jgi:hypothetical protein
MNDERLKAAWLKFNERIAALRARQKAALRRFVERQEAERAKKAREAIEKNYER